MYIIFKRIADIANMTAASGNPMVVNVWQIFLQWIREPSLLKTWNIDIPMAALREKHWNVQWNNPFSTWFCYYYVTNKSVRPSGVNLDSRGKFGQSGIVADDLFEDLCDVLFKSNGNFPIS